MFSCFAGPNSAVQDWSQPGISKAIKTAKTTEAAKSQLYHVMMNVLTKCQILFTVATTIVIVMLIILYVKCQIKTSICL